MPTVKNFLFPALLFFFVFSLVAQVSAQTIESNQISATISPEQPGPQEKVTISLVSFAINLDRSSITWTLDGKKSLSGAGEKKFSFTTGVVGETSRVSVSIVSPSGEVIPKSFSITPEELTLIWEAPDSYTPPFYKGKALPSSQGSIKIVAMPNIKSGGVITKPENLLYKWRRNDKAAQDASGFGKNTFSIRNSITDIFEKIEVTVTSADGSISALSGITISIVNPQVAFYENRPLEGVYYESVLPGNFVLDNEEIKINAEPYYFSSTNKNKLDFAFSWLVGGKETVSDKSDPSAISLRIERGASGSSNISLSVKNAKKILQEATANLTVKFGTI
ncbi:MAG: hypothetical protein A2648_01050 [Candidatus Lloydbacteria bacterium RIFCSPHIGHO2_01_FULL_41_20]|uniref:Uncharacterized protein n=1 Tax=Candidatus Lloydbacteria bacterium RIFCSPHIGHO2_01_FULL_41_20 TaxID=1798657 RepID=A0A1G2CSG4_9BACT|nr:MAG: hypothetical protein A2648_01050 [Candidatus Lloydbacteria bacterium RIFCSPHIGHO2_01_FULL_41_20]